MSEVTESYNAQVDALKADMEAFIEAAEAGADGRGSKVKALAARKLSSKIGKSMKEFRSISVANDKAK